MLYPAPKRKPKPEDHLICSPLRVLQSFLIPTRRIGGFRSVNHTVNVFYLCSPDVTVSVQFFDVKGGMKNILSK